MQIATRGARARGRRGRRHRRAAGGPVRAARSRPQRAPRLRPRASRTRLTSASSVSLERRRSSASPRSRCGTPRRSGPSPLPAALRRRPGAAAAGDRPAAVCTGDLHVAAAGSGGRGGSSSRRSRRRCPGRSRARSGGSISSPAIDAFGGDDSHGAAVWQRPIPWKSRKNDEGRATRGWPDAVSTVTLARPMTPTLRDQRILVRPGSSASASSPLGRARCGRPTPGCAAACTPRSPPWSWRARPSPSSPRSATFPTWPGASAPLALALAVVGFAISLLAAAEIWRRILAALGSRSPPRRSHGDLVRLGAWPLRADQPPAAGAAGRDGRARGRAEAGLRWRAWSTRSASPLPPRWSSAPTSSIDLPDLSGSPGTLPGGRPARDRALVLLQPRFFHTFADRVLRPARP